MTKHSIALAGALSLCAMLSITGTSFGSFELAAQAQSQTPPPAASPQTPTPQANPGDLTEADRMFAQQVATSGKAEIAMAKLAQQKATNDRIKAYAKQLEQDHMKADAALQKIVGTAVKAEEPPQVKQHFEHLSQMSGAEFDRGYIAQMVDAHKTAVANFEKYASTGMHADLKNFAQTTLPTLKQHLQQAEQLHKQLVTSSANH